MKIYVNEMPTDPNKCLFSSKEKHSNVFKINTDATIGEREVIYKYYCNVNGRLCDLENGCKQCNKLKVLMK